MILTVAFFVVLHGKLWDGDSLRQPCGLPPPSKREAGMRFRRQKAPSPRELARQRLREFLEIPQENVKNLFVSASPQWQGSYGREQGTGNRGTTSSGASRHLPLKGIDLFRRFAPPSPEGDRPLPALRATFPFRGRWQPAGLTKEVVPFRGRWQPAGLTEEVVPFILLSA